MKNKKMILIIVCFVLIMTILITLLAFCIIEIVEKNNNKNDVTLTLDALSSEISKIPSFNTSRMRDVSIDDIGKIFGIDETYIKNVVGKVPLLNISSSMYVILELNDEKDVDTVKERLENYASTYEKSWKSYMEDQYNLVLDRKIGNNGKYVYLIISDDKKDILELIDRL